MKRYLGAILPALLSVILYGVTVFGFILPTTEHHIMAKKREMTRELANTVWNILATYDRQVKAGSLTLSEAQKRAINRIQALRYGSNGKDYFWINDMDAVVVMHPYRKDLVGRNLMDFRDPLGKRMFSEFVRVVRERGAGYVAYHWQWMDDPTRIEPKISYVKGFKPWNWVVGTGIYTDDVRQEMHEMTRNLTIVGLGVLFLVALLSGYLTIREVRAERKSQEATESLREMMEKYRAVLESSPDPVILYDSKGNTTYVNPAFTRVFGWQAEEVLGRRIDFVPKEEASKTMDAIQEVFVGPRGMKSMESRRLTKHGATLDVMINAAVYRGDDGSPVGMVVNLTDITNIKRAEEALRQSEEKFRSISANALDGIIMIDPYGCVIFWNQAAAKIFGYSAAEVLGRKLHDTIAPERYINDYRQAFTEFAESGRGNAVGRMVELMALHKDGVEFPVELSVSALQMHDQWYAVGIVRDITERKRAEEALRNSEQRYRAILQSVPNSVVISDRDAGRILEVNERFCELTGYDQSEAIGKTFPELNLYADPADHKRLAKMINEQGDINMANVVYQDRYGTKVDGLVAVRPFFYSGRQCLLSVTQDITPLRKAEEEQLRLQAQLQRAQRMEAIGTLAGGVAHDFNNLLQAISGYTQLILGMQQLPEKVKEYAADIDHAAFRASDLVQRLLTFSRKVEPEFKPVDLNAEVTGAVKMLERTIPKMIEITTDLKTDLWPVMADPNQIEQVLMNLGANSRDAMPEGGTLSMSSSNVVFERERVIGNEELGAGNYVLICVKDTGQGMDAETVKKIYDPFYSTKGVGKGTGLGMSIVYGIVEGHGGKIICNSQLGKGTEFLLYLPAAIDAPSKEEARPETREKAPGGTETILVVDDEMPLLKVSNELLAQKGYSVKTASSGEEAVELCQKEGKGIDLVIMDLGMPGMGGRRALEEILRNDPQAKVIISSGYSSPSEFDGKMNGAKAYIDKPFRLDNLLRLIRTVLD